MPRKTHEPQYPHKSIETWMNMENFWNLPISREPTHWTTPETIKKPYKTINQRKQGKGPASWAWKAQPAGSAEVCRPTSLRLKLRRWNLRQQAGGGGFGSDAYYGVVRWDEPFLSISQLKRFEHFFLNHFFRLKRFEDGEPMVFEDRLRKQSYQSIVVSWSQRLASYVRIRAEHQLSERGFHPAMFRQGHDGGWNWVFSTGRWVRWGRGVQLSTHHWKVLKQRRSWNLTSMPFFTMLLVYQLMLALILMTTSDTF